MSIEIAMKKTGFPHLVTKQLGMGWSKFWSAW
jgi:hypothetical protein